MVASSEVHSHCAPWPKMLSCLFCTFYWSGTEMAEAGLQVLIKLLSCFLVRT
ncbi:hypothetical protein BJX65DRAFT_266265 [Aspergillus insuetus]